MDDRDPRDAMAIAAERVLREWFESRKPWRVIGDSLEYAMLHFLRENREHILEIIARAALEKDADPAELVRRVEERFQRQQTVGDDSLPPLPDDLDHL